MYINQLHQGSSKPIVHNLPKMVAETPLGVKREGEEEWQEHTELTCLFQPALSPVRGPAEGRLLKRAEVMPVAPHPRIRALGGNTGTAIATRRVTQEGDQSAWQWWAADEDASLWVMAPWAREGEEAPVPGRQRWREWQEEDHAQASAHFLSLLS